MRLVRSLLSVLLILVALPLAAQNLEIHYINVGWGGSVFIKGPDGTTVLLEAGNTGLGTQYVVPYLKSIGVQPVNGLDYVVGGHQHCDHIGGLGEVLNAGYNVRVKQYSNGSAYASPCVDSWNSASAATTAGAPIAMPVGTVIALGGGATLTCIARDGSIIGGGSVAVSNENDRSIALLIKYGGFDYIWASDLGGGPDSCTGRGTLQLDVETSIINAISPGGTNPLISAGGVDLMHVNHHGSESSTNPTYFSKIKPAVAIIGVGAGESAGWDLPRIKVVDSVLLGAATSCVTAPPTFVLQSEEGSPASTNTSRSGYCVGNIKVTTDGVNIFTVSADGAVHQGPNELVASGLPRSFTIDDAAAGDTVAPTTSITAPLAGATVSGTTTVTASASDNVGVTKVEFYLDGTLQSTATTSPYSWSWNTTTATNGSHSLMSKAYDAALNVGSSAAVSVTVSNAVSDTTPPATSITAPLAGATVSGTTTVSASASDNVGVTKVEFYLDGTLQTTDTTSPYSWNWNTTTATNGTHSLTSKAYDAAANVGSSAAVSVTVSNAVADTTPPATSITAPAAGATVSGTTTVTASASDNVGVTKVEFSLDGTLQSTSTASPYSWSWNTTTATNGSHSLTSKAYDAAGNVGTSAAVSVTVSNGAAVNIGGWTLIQANATLNYTIPAGTTIASKGYVIIARNATKTAFQTFWGVTLAANVVYINSANTMPQINGSETYTLKNGATTVDGPTVAMDTSAGYDFERATCGAAGTLSSWMHRVAGSATPGSAGLGTCSRGVFLNEFSDAVGTGNYIYEFVELYNDK